MPKLVTNKPKAKSAKLRSARAGARPATARMGAIPMQPSDTTAHEAMLTGLTDPFSDEASSARYPDQGSGKSLTWTQRFSVPLGSSPAGNGAFCVNPKSNFPYLFGDIVGSTITWQATFSGDMGTSLLVTHGYSFRPTSFGIRINNTLSATESSGRLVIARGGNAISASTTTIAPNNFTTWDVHPLVHGGEWHAVGCPRSSNAYNMAPLTYDATTQGNREWETIYVFVLGTQPSAVPLYIEITLNYEYVPVEDSVIAQLAERQPTFSAPMITAINEVQSNHPGSHKGTGAVVKSFIKKEGKKALLKHVLPFVAKKAVQFLA